MTGLAERMLFDEGLSPSEGKSFSCFLHFLKPFQVVKSVLII